MRLRGWNDIPQGFGAGVDLRNQPAWLVVLHRLPLFDRFSYPLLARRGGVYLVPPKDDPSAQPPAGWTVRMDDDEWSEMRWGSH